MIISVLVPLPGYSCYCFHYTWEGIYLAFSGKLMCQRASCGLLCVCKVKQWGISITYIDTYVIDQEEYISDIPPAGGQRFIWGYTPWANHVEAYWILMRYISLIYHLHFSTPWCVYILSYGLPQLADAAFQYQTHNCCFCYIPIDDCWRGQSVV